MTDDFYFRFSFLLPKRLVSMCVVRVWSSVCAWYEHPNDVCMVEALKRFDPGNESVRLRVIK